MSIFLGGLWVFLAVLRYVVWPIVLISLFGPFGLIIWLFIH